MKSVNQIILVSLTKCFSGFETVDAVLIIEGILSGDSAEIWNVKLHCDVFIENNSNLRN